MSDLKNISDLPESQQKVLLSVLRVNRPSFRTSEIHKKLSDQMTGRSVGAVLGALYRNGYLDKVSGGRDKSWRLSKLVQEKKIDMAKELNSIKQYWS